MTPVWLDCDMGVDDAVALMTLGRQKELRLAGISAVAGNAELCRTYGNARDVSRLLGLDAPVYPGAERPLFQELRTASAVHGENGLGGAALPPSGAPDPGIPAWDALYRAAAEEEGELQVIAVGPLTNLAIALGKYPRLKTLLKRILLMGGAARGGNVTPAAEFNILADPHAAQLVFRSGIPIVMCGLDVTEKAYLTRGETEALGAGETPVRRFFRDCTAKLLRWHEELGDPGLTLHDVCPVLYLTHPELFRGEEAGVYVETRGTVSNGKTVTDLWSDKKFPDRHVFVVLEVDREGFAAQVRDAVLAY